MRRRGISEKVLYAYNPLPNVSEADLFELDDLGEFFEPSSRSPFEFTWKYGSGLELETVHLVPGEMLPLRESEATEFMRATNAHELGLCILDSADPNTASNRKAVREALLAAAKYYQSRGATQLLKQKKVHNYTDADMRDMRATLHAYYLNKAKEKAIRDHIAELRKAPRKAA